MASMMTVTGRLGIDPELRDAKDNKVCNVVVYSPEYGGESLRVDGSLWGKTAEFCANYAKKGDWVSVSGIPVLETWENRDGEKQTGLKFRKIFEFNICQNKEKTEDDEPKRDL